MDALKIDNETDRHVRAFRATDAFTLEAFQAARAIGRGDGEGLALEIRRAAARSGGALVAASAGEASSSQSRSTLESARSGLLELRYYLYLARRLGFLDVKRYRQLAVRQDAALREIDGLIGPRERPPP